MNIDNHLQASLAICSTSYNNISNHTIWELRTSSGVRQSSGGAGSC